LDAEKLHCSGFDFWFVYYYPILKADENAEQRENECGYIPLISDPETATCDQFHSAVEISHIRETMEYV
jgi:hypothetical protein